MIKLSRAERPEGSLPTFVGGAVADGRNPYPSHYRMAFAFSLVLYPPSYRRTLRCAFPGGGRRAYHVPRLAHWML